MFTKAQITEIAALLNAAAVKDSSFDISDALDGTEYATILQNKKNKRVLVAELLKYFYDEVSPIIASAISTMSAKVEADYENAMANISILTAKIDRLTDKIDVLIDSASYGHAPIDDDEIKGLLSSSAPN